MSETEKKPRAPRKKKVEPMNWEPASEEHRSDAPEPETPADPPKSTQGMRPVQFAEPVEQDGSPADLPAEDLGGEATEDGRPVLARDSLVRNNDYARNSRSVRAVQDALDANGHWDVRADPAGYWGAYTQAAAVAETGEEDPVAAAEAMGFTVI